MVGLKNKCHSLSKPVDIERKIVLPIKKERKKWVDDDQAVNQCWLNNHFVKLILYLNFIN